MNHSEQTAKFSQAFVKAQAEIGAAAKDTKNPHFNSKYADLSSVTDAIRPALAKHGLAYMQEGTLLEGNRISMTTRVIHESGEWHEFVMIVPSGKSDVQGAGSSLTYARRYSLSGIFGVTAEDDDGNAASNLPAKTYTAPSKPYTPPAKPAPTIAPAAPSLKPAEPVKAAAPVPPENLPELLAACELAARTGIPAYQKAWTALTAAEKNAIGTAQHEKNKAIALAVKVAA